MQLLFTGRGTSGSWSIRGEQLGQACNAVVRQAASAEHCKAADVIVAVKRVNDPLLAALRESGRPWAFDCVDFYPQPHCTGWSRVESIEWVKAQIKRLGPSAVIWPNRRMREDCDTGLPGMVLPHHHRPGIAVNPVRHSVQTVGYEGATPYLGYWRAAIESECSRRGWKFVANPARLADLDIVVAFRSMDFSGYAQHHWKSNVKLANAHGSGTPFIGQRECGYLETASGCEYWADEPKQLGMCFDWLESQETRELISDRFRDAAYPIEKAAADLNRFLATLR